jgi:hypothetical protein
MYPQIRQPKVELGRLEKKLDWPLDEKRGVVEPDHPRANVALP